MKISFIANRVTQGLHKLVIPTKDRKDYRVVQEHIDSIVSPILLRNRGVDESKLNIYQLYLLQHASVIAWDEESKMEWIISSINNWREILNESIKIYNTWWSKESSIKFKNNPLTVERYCELLGLK
jgi:hypothetical protein